VSRLGYAHPVGTPGAVFTRGRSFTHFQGGARSAARFLSPYAAACRQGLYGLVREGWLQQQYDSREARVSELAAPAGLAERSLSKDNVR